MNKLSFNKNYMYILKFYCTIISQTIYVFRALLKGNFSTSVVTRVVKNHDLKKSDLFYLIRFLFYDFFFGYFLSIKLKYH